MEPILDLVAVSYNAFDQMMPFLESLQYVNVPYTLVIIDNASPDQRTPRLLASTVDHVGRSPNCVRYDLVLSDTNDGYARASNHGVSLGTAPYVGVLNCDVQFLKNSAKNLVDELEANPDVGVVGPKTYDSSGRLTHGGIIRNDRGGDEHRFWRQTDHGQANDTLDVPTVSGATYFVRRKMWDELTNCEIYRRQYPDVEGAFLPTRHYYEETFCSYHARAHGWKVRYLGSAEMIHEWHKSSPVGGEAEGWFKQSEAMFKHALLTHGIEVPR